MAAQLRQTSTFSEDCMHIVRTKNIWYKFDDFVEILEIQGVHTEKAVANSGESKSCK